MEARTLYYVDTRKLTLLMSQKNLNIRQLSLKSGVSRSTIINVIKGSNPTGSTISSIANALELTAREITDVFFNRKIT